MTSRSSKSVQEILFHLNELAPLSQSESWDNVGLLLGDPTWKTPGAVISVDLTQEALDLAAAHQIQLVITHHPCIFPQSKGVTNLVAGSLAFEAIRRGIAVASYHTNFDRCALQVVESISQGLQVNPQGRLHDNSADQALDSGKGLQKGFGYGFWGEFTCPRPFSELLKDVTTVFNVNGFWITKPTPSFVTRVGFSAGKGTSFVESAASVKCDVFITGEVGYHHALQGTRLGMTVIELGHRESEKFFIETMRSWLLDLGLKVIEVRTPTQMIFSGGMK